MRGSNGIILIAVGLLILWLAISQKYQCATLAFNCLIGEDSGNTGGGTGTAPANPGFGGGLRKIFPPVLPFPETTKPTGRTPSTFPGTRSYEDIFRLPKVP